MATVVPPPRPAITLPDLPNIVPLEQLWTRLPPMRRQDLLGQLTRILAQRLAPTNSQEEANE